MTSTTDASNRPPRKGLAHIRELDGLRGIAALLVFLFHVCSSSITEKQCPHSLLWLHKISASGAHGVDLFFVLSGFLITSLLIEARNRPAYYHDFYWKRALRILPIYILCLMWLYFEVAGSGRYILLSVLFLSNFASPFHVANIGPFWTLSIEEQFYLLWPAVIRRRTVAQIARIAAAVTVGAMILRVVVGFAGYDDYALTFLRCDGLGAGAMLACWYSRRMDGAINRRRDALCIVLGLSLGAALVAVHGVSSVTIADAHQTGVTLLCASVVGLAIAYAGTNKVAIFRSPVFAFFGLISYAIYMFHLYIMDAYDNRFGPPDASHLTRFVVRIFGILGFTVLVSLVSRYAVELPAMSLRRFVLATPSDSVTQDPLR